MTIKFTDGKGNSFDKKITRSQAKRILEPAYTWNGNFLDYDWFYHLPHPEERANCKEGYVLTAHPKEA